MSKKTCKRTRKGRGFDLQICGRNLDPALAGKVEAAGRWLCLQMMGARICNTITVKISLVLDVGSKEVVGTTGVCWSANVGSKVQNAFAITLDKTLGLASMVAILAHEIRHVEQIRRGRLQYRRWTTDRQVHARWDGVEMGPVASLPYMTRPWEVEAYATKEIAALALARI